MRNRQACCRRRARATVSTAAKALPTCSSPVGDGAYRPTPEDDDDDDSDSDSDNEDEDDDDSILI